MTSKFAVIRFSIHTWNSDEKCPSSVFYLPSDGISLENDGASDAVGNIVEAYWVKNYDDVTASLITTCGPTDGVLGWS